MPHLHLSIAVMLVILSLSITACDQDTNNKSMSSESDQQITQNSQSLTFLGLQSYIPEDWQIVPPASSMRAAQAVAPGNPNAEMVVFYFGPNQGGPVDANISRWQGQFRQIAGQPIQPVREHFKTTAGYTVSWVEFRGDYARGVGMGPVGDYKKDQMLIAAITESPRGNLYIQFHGNAADVINNKSAYRYFVEHLELASE